MASLEGLAEEHSECAICFEPLHSLQCSVFLRQGARSCTHFFHSECIAALRDRTCPICRQEYDSVAPVPAINLDPAGWFALCDRDGDGMLTQAEVGECLRASFPIDSEVPLTQCGCRRQWDTDNNGSIEYHELFAPNGLANYVQQHLLSNAAASNPPSLEQNKLAWFSFFDQDEGGTLSKHEVTRALIKTYNQDNANAGAIRSILDNIWCIFDHDGSGEIDKDEFVAPDGLADTIIASKVYDRLNCQSETS